MMLYSSHLNGHKNQMLNHHQPLHSVKNGRKRNKQDFLIVDLKVDIKYLDLVHLKAVKYRPLNTRDFF